jgi:hypothetical protein
MDSWIVGGEESGRGGKNTYGAIKGEEIPQYVSFRFCGGFDDKFVVSR